MKHTGRIFFYNGSQLDINYDLIDINNNDKIIFKKDDGEYLIPIAIFSFENIAGFIYDLREGSV